MTSLSYSFSHRPLHYARSVPRDAGKGFVRFRWSQRERRAYYPRRSSGYRFEPSKSLSPLTESPFASTLPTARSLAPSLYAAACSSLVVTVPLLRSRDVSSARGRWGGTLAKGMYLVSKIKYVYKQFGLRLSASYDASLARALSFSAVHRLSTSPRGAHWDDFAPHPRHAVKSPPRTCSRYCGHGALTFLFGGAFKRKKLPRSSMLACLY